ncbi:hypothetical protein CCR75_006952 [Bremia lactucae]|uniref:Uncharacterized protein n=1 Tax=Bremia lactucae TaxID=4779 RepID=A0A976IK02_BRELC|nr:hypothetical protein CCR75_006952 [Bremia lactucae]
MIILRRATVAPPAPINTPSLERQGRLQNTRVSLVPAASYWAEGGAKMQKASKLELPTASADGIRPTEAFKKVRAPESEAKRIHTDSSLTHTKLIAETSGRWGDDAVEHDIAHQNICYQARKETEFPDLNGSVKGVIFVDESIKCAAASNDSPLQQPEQQQHGRATGRWARINAELPSSRSWCAGYDDHSEDFFWRKNCASHSGKNRNLSSCSPNCRDASDQVDQSYKSASNGLVNTLTHYRHCDARDDLFASKSRNSSIKSDGLAHQNGSIESHSPVPTISDQPNAYSSVEMDRFNLSPSKQQSICGWGRSRQMEEKTPESSSEPSLNFSTYHSTSLQNAAQSLECPKMLFDPVTGVMVNAHDELKRRTDGRNAKDRTFLEPTVASRRCKGLLEEKATRKSREKSRSILRNEKAPAAALTNDAGSLMQEAKIVHDAKKNHFQVSNGVSTAPDENKVLARQSKAKHAPKRLVTTIIDNCQLESGLSDISRQQREASHYPAVNIRESNRPGKGTNFQRSRHTTTANCGQSDLQSCKGLQGCFRKKEDMAAQSLNFLPSTTAPIAFGSSGDVVKLVTEVECFHLAPQDDGFQTVKSRRVVLNESKQARQHLSSIKATDLAPNDTKYLKKKQQRSGEHMNKHCGLKVKVTDNLQTPSEPQKEKIKFISDPVQSLAENRSKTKRPKQAKQPKKKIVPAKSSTKGCKRSSEKTMQTVMDLTEHLADMASTDSPGFKYGTQHVNAISATVASKNSSPSFMNDRKTAREPKIIDQKTIVDNKPSGVVAKRKPKQVYVVKTNTV